MTPLALVIALSGIGQEVSPVLACFELARDETLLSSTESQLLCKGTYTVGPVQCYVAADDETFLDTDQLIALCRCARDTSPVPCFDQARLLGELSTSDAIEFCMPIMVDHLWPDCTPRESY